MSYLQFDQHPSQPFQTYPSAVLHKGEAPAPAGGVPRASKLHLHPLGLPLAVHIVVGEGPWRGLERQVQLSGCSLLLLQRACLPD